MHVVVGGSQVYSKNSTTLGGASYIIKKSETSEVDMNDIEKSVCILSNLKIEEYNNFIEQTLGVNLLEMSEEEIKKIESKINSEIYEKGSQLMKQHNFLRDLIALSIKYKNN